MTDRILSVVSLLVALGAVGFAYQSKKPEPPAREARPPIEPAPSTYDEELEGRVAALEWVISALSRRLETVETSVSRQPVMAQAAGQQQAALPGDLGQRIQQLQQDVDALFSASVLDTDHGRERAKEALRDLQNELAMDRVRERERVREQASRERFERFAQEARLTPVQTQRLQGVLEGEQSERRALFERMQAGGGNRGEMAREMRALREKTDTAAREILSNDEFQQYQEMRRAEGGGRGPGRGQGSWGQGQGEGRGEGRGRGNRERGAGQEGQGRRGPREAR